MPATRPVKARPRSAFGRELYWQPDPSTRMRLLRGSGGTMLTREENELLTRTGPGTPMGEMMRRYWLPALLSAEVPEPDGDPKQLRLLGEDLVAFRDTRGRVGLLAEYCPHRGASLLYGRN